MNDRLTEVPKPDGSDLARKAMVAIASVIPFAAPIVDMVLPSPFGNKLIKWLMELKEDFEKLEKKVGELDAKALAEDEEFMTTMLNAARIVSYTHRKEKHEMLRNAVLNSALPEAPVDDERLVFLNLVDEFSVVHIRILFSLKKFKAPQGLSLSLSDPQWRINSQLNTLYDLLSKHLQEPRPQYQFFVLDSFRCLHARALIANSPLRTSAHPTLSRLSHTSRVNLLRPQIPQVTSNPLLTTETLTATRGRLSRRGRCSCGTQA